MKRLPVVVAALVALVVLVLGGGLAAYLSLSDGATAFRAAGQTVSQQSLDQELKALAGSSALATIARESKSPEVAPVPGSIASNYSAGWVTLRIDQAFVDQEVTARHVKVTSGDRAAGAALADQLLGSPQVSRALPSSTLDRFTRMAALQAALLNDPSAGLAAGAAAQCPSHRFVAAILVGSQAQAQSIQAQLAAGASFETLARQDSLDQTSARQGGEIGCLDSEQFVAAFEQAAQADPVGQVTSPVDSQYGWFLILVRSQPQPSDLATLALDKVTNLARGEHVSLNPRYGIWDRPQGRVVPPVAPASHG